MEKYELSEQDAKELADFLVPILDFVPEKRPTAAKLLNHPWITGISQNLGSVMTPAYDNNILDDNRVASVASDTEILENNRVAPVATDNKILENKKEKDEREAMEFHRSKYVRVKVLQGYFSATFQAQNRDHNGNLWLIGRMKGHGLETIYPEEVKPSLPYLDVIRLFHDNSSLPIAAYHMKLFFELTKSKRKTVGEQEKNEKCGQGPYLSC
ncbi:hypothetical protein L1987_59907 [Smallanthus sonchifolius]|uniref:Uncharacterized protein n=1 Tax=Smallanthus sonchifolius TaxID=185202 RepID=A0ACB9D7E3_9ASTR|nr:hypothetical protein L1987_59907 [Smallanthus sonchifolius]